MTGRWGTVGCGGAEMTSKLLNMEPKQGQMKTFCEIVTTSGLGIICERPTGCPEQRRRSCALPLIPRDESEPIVEFDAGDSINKQAVITLPSACLKFIPLPVSAVFLPGASPPVILLDAGGHWLLSLKEPSVHSGLWRRHCDHTSLTRR